MKLTRVIMGMPVTVEVVGAEEDVLEQVFKYFTEVDERFSTYKNSSEISKINRGKLEESEFSPEMREIFALAEKTKRDTEGYFDIRTPAGKIDPSGIVKGWAIHNAAKLVRELGYTNFWVEAGGDIQVSGTNADGNPWRVGIRNPFNRNEIVKVVHLQNAGIATSGDYIRGSHIYNPHTGKPAISQLASITVIGPNVYEADRYATAAYAMGTDGVAFIAKLPGFEGYSIDKYSNTTMTSGFTRYTSVQDKTSV